MDSVWSFKFFGGLELARCTKNGECEEKRFRPQKTASLLALLVLRGSRTREELCDIFWPESVPEAARNSLSAALSSLRREFSDDLICADRYRVGLAQNLASDVAQFDQAFNNQQWNKAVELYRGPLLPGFYDEPLVIIAREYEEKARVAFREQLTELENRNAFDVIRQHARRAIALLGGDQLWYLALMKAHRVESDSDAALHVYEELQQWANKNGEAVSEDAYQFAKVLRREKRQAKPTLSLEVPAPRMTYPPSSVPTQWTRFFGREEEKAALRSLLENGRKLVTLTGTGGAGKTRFAIETLHSVLPTWKGPVYFVPLAPLQNANLLFDTIRDALQLPVAPDLPPLEQIAQALHGANALLCLDNFEQIVERGALLLQALREHLPQMTFLVTSRVLLNLPGEHEYAVSPLPLPQDELPMEEMLRYPGIGLFCDRAQTHLASANPRAIATLCRRLEGIPLALELAAARAKVLSPTQILELLDTRPDFLRGKDAYLAPRHRTLRATIEWSINLLEPQLRLFFKRLAVFRGGWTLEAAEQIVASGVCETDQVLDYLEQLRSHSLIVTQNEEETPRFRMLEMLREWGEAELNPEEKRELQQRHFEFYLSLVESIHDPVTLANRIGEIAAENANFRLALAYALNRTDKAAANDMARFVGALCNFWELRAQHSEGGDWVDRALEKSGAIEACWQARLYCCGGVMQFYCGDYLRARMLLETGLAIYQQLQDVRGQAWALNYSGRALFVMGRGDEARRNGEAAMELAQSVGDMPRLIGSVMTAAWGCHTSGHPLDAVKYFDQCLALCELVGERRLAAICHSTKAFALFSAGQLEASRVQCEIALNAATDDLGAYIVAFARGTTAIPLLELGDVERVRQILPDAVSVFYAVSTRWELSCMLVLCANLATVLGEFERATLLYGAAEALCEGGAYVMLSCITELLPAYEQRLEGELGVERKEFLRQLGRQMPLESVFELTHFRPINLQTEFVGSAARAYGISDSFLP